jgi:hypothetical protein
MGAGWSVERAVKDAEGQQRRHVPVVDLDVRCRRIVLNRLVIVGQVGAQAAFDERCKIDQSPHRQTRGLPRERSSERLQMARHQMKAARLLEARPLADCAPGPGWGCVRDTDA